MNQNKIGNLIAKCRKEKNLTQKELAERLNVSDKSVSKWERGICLPDVSLYKDLCNILDISLNEFFAGERVKEENFKEVADNNLLISLKQKKQFKKVYLLFIPFIIILILGIYYHNTKETPYYGTSTTIIEGEDGWYYELTMNYQNPKYDEHVFSKYNLKYLKECNSLNNDENKKNDLIRINACISNVNVDEDTEAINISQYFDKKQFNKTITEKNLRYLKTSFYEKEILVKLYNKAIIEKKIDSKIRNKYDLHHFEYRSDSVDDGYKVNVGILADRLGVQIFRIDLEYEDGTYLSDLINENEATDKQK